MVLATNGVVAKKTRRLREIAAEAGLTEARKWNLSDVLRKAKPYVIRTSDGWELTSDGRDHVHRLVPASKVSGASPNSASELRTLLPRINSQETRIFVEEAIVCLEHGACRAAVVLSWIGAVAVLYDYVLSQHLTTFNQEALRRNTKWRGAKTTDDLARMKETDFLDVLESLSIIGKSSKKALQHALDLRNGCGHPNSFVIGDSVVRAHIETLILNVFTKF